MEYHIEAGSKTKRFIESLLPSMLEQLKLTRSRRLLHIIVDGDDGHSGQTLPLLGINTLLVVLKPTRQLHDLGITLAHELTHVAQFAKGTHQVTPKGKRWKSEFYGQNVAYLQQPWEIDAFVKEELIFRRAIE